MSETLLPGQLPSQPPAAPSRRRGKGRGQTSPDDHPSSGRKKLSLQPVTYRKHWHDPPAGVAPPVFAKEESVLSSLLLEVTDAQDNPLIYLPQEAVLRQNLYCRMVLVALRGNKNTLLLQKALGTLPGRQGKWDLFTGMVRANEAREDTALRLLQAIPALPVLPLALVATRPGDRELPAHASLFVADLPRGTFFESTPLPETLTVDEDELFGLVRDIPDLLTPELIWAAHTHAAFRPRGKR